MGGLGSDPAGPGGSLAREMGCRSERSLLPKHGLSPEWGGLQSCMDLRFLDAGCCLAPTILVDSWHLKPSCLAPGFCQLLL